MRLHNEGAAFSFLAGASGWQRWMFTGLGLAVSVGIFIWLRRLPANGQGLLAAGLALVMGGGLKLSMAGVAVGSVVGVPIRITAAEEVLASGDDPNRFDEAGLAAASVVNPDDDLDGSAEYKRHLVSVVVSRVSRRAVEGGAKDLENDLTE